MMDTENAKFIHQTDLVLNNDLKQEELQTVFQTLQNR